MALATHSEVYGWPTYYEVNDAATSFQYDPTFYTQLETWASFYYVNTPSTWVNPGRLYSLGVYVASSPPMHSLGRAFDLTRIQLTVNGISTVVCNAQTIPGSPTPRKYYWAAAASLHYHFTYVITYPFKSSNGLFEHTNHIHIDNQVSGSGSVFSTSAKTQVQFVQHSLVYVWGYTAVTLDGVYGPQTADYASRALDRSGAPGALTSLANWQRFCLTTTRFGTGTQSY